MRTSFSPTYAAPAFTRRLAALLIDGLVAGLFGAIPFIGGLVGGLYLVARDGLEIDGLNGRSVGKYVLNLDVRHTDGGPIDLERSVRRNWMFGIGALAGVLLYIPLIGWLFIPGVVALSLGLAMYEGYRALTDERGRRWGDVLADTQVIEER